MATLPAWRRRGAAAVVLGCLAEQASDLGAENVYLAVMQSNAGARKLYESVGFSTVHEYCYLERPPEVLSKTVASTHSALRGGIAAST